MFIANLDLLLIDDLQIILLEFRVRCATRLTSFTFFLEVILKLQPRSRLLKIITAKDVKTCKAFVSVKNSAKFFTIFYSSIFYFIVFLIFI